MLKVYKNIRGYDMKYVEYKKMCRKAWSRKYSYLCIDMAKNKKEGKYRIFNENKNRYIDYVCETEIFQFLKCCFY